MRRLLVMGIAAGVAGLALLALSVQPPRYAHLDVSYRGTPPHVPRRFTVHEAWSPRRSIPFWSATPRWSLFGGWYQSDRTDHSERTIPAGPTGFSASFDLRRPVSLGHYELAAAQVESEPGPEVQPLGECKPFEEAVVAQLPARRRPTVSGEVAHLEYHFLDVATSATTFSLPAPTHPWEPPSSRITIDFEPIVYTSFVGLPDHARWSKLGARCSVFVVAPGLPRTLRFEVTRSPGAPPGPVPARRATEVVLVDDETYGRSDIRDNERPDPAGWAALRAHAIRPDGVGLDLDPVAGTLTVTIASPSALGAGDDDPVLFIGTPSADGRYFGVDCVTLRAESPSSMLPVLTTEFTELAGLGPNRPARDAGAPRCADPALPRIYLWPRVSRPIPYRTLLAGDGAPAPGQLPPRPARPTEVFLLDPAVLEKVSAPVTPAQWASLRSRSVRTDSVRLEHDPAATRVDVTVLDAPASDLALVVGTRSADGRSFGFDCARLHVVR